MKQVVIKDPNKLFFTSDLHFGHANIIRYCDRPFNDVDHMNDMLVNEWNSVIQDHDNHIFILGDFAWGDKADWERYLNRLHGMKYLVFGNHDRYGCIPFFKFQRVFEGFAEIYVHEEGGGQAITACHYPMLSWNHSHKGSWNLFGHWHSGTVRKREGDDDDVALYVKSEEQAYNKLRPTQYDVGVDGNGYRPVSYFQIKKIINDKKSKENKGRN